MPTFVTPDRRAGTPGATTSLHPDPTLPELRLAADDPLRIPQLMAADPASLSPHAVALRRHIESWADGRGGEVIDGPATLARLLRTASIVTAPGRWLTLALGSRGERLRTATDGGYVRWRSLITDRVPDPQELPAVPPGGKYLLVYRGGVSVLTNTGVAHRLRALHDAFVGAGDQRRRVRLADVTVWDTDAAGGPVLYAISCGEGGQAGVSVPLPAGDVVSGALGDLAPDGLP